MRSGGKVLHAYVAAHAASASAAVGIVFVDDRGDVVRRVGRRLQEVQPEPARDLAAFRGILHALWNARRRGCRRVIVHSDHPGVVAQINGVCEVRFGLIGPYLEVRALLHAYRSARVEVDVSGWVEEARALAAAALAADVADDIVRDLPLWAGPGAETGSSGRQGPAIA